MKTTCLRFIIFTLSLAFATRHDVSAEPAADEQPAVGQWQILETQGAPTKRHECAFIECEGKFYLIGGRGILPVNVFDPQSRTWTAKARTPIEMHHFQPVVFQGRIYLLGVLTGPYPNEVPVPHIWIYDPTTDTWTVGPDIPEDRRRGSCGVVVHADKFYMVCGIKDGHQGDHKQWLDQFDPATGQWQALPDAPRTRDHFQAVVMGDKLYAAGGRNTSRRTNQVFELTIKEVDVYDFTTGQWSTLPSPQQDIPTPRAGTAAVVSGNELLIIGGESGQRDAHNEVEALNSMTGVWRTLALLVQGRHGSGAGVVAEGIFISAGSAQRGGGPELDSIEFYSTLPASDD